MVNDEKLVDRDRETSLIIDDIIENKQTIIRMIYAPTAIGKSSFTNKVLNNIQKNNILQICVRTFPENISSQHADWEYFEFLFEKVINLSINNKTIKSFEKYIQNDPIINQENKSSIYKNIKKFSLKSIIESIINGYLKRPLSIDEYGSYSIISDNSLKSKMIKKNYLKNIFNNNRVCLIIDNIQNIDKQSLKMIMDIVSETKNNNHYIIFEYTLTQKNNKEKMYDLILFFKNFGISCKELNLKKLPIEYIVDFVDKNVENKPTAYEFNKRLLEYYDKLPDGNLLQVLSFVNNYKVLNKEKKYNGDETYTTIKNLKVNSSKLLLSLILQNNGRIFIQTAKEVFINLELNNLKEAYTELEQNKLIVVDDYLNLKHASIKDSWINSQDQEFINNDIIIRNTLEQIYLGSLENPNIIKVSLNKLPWLALLEIYKIKYPQKIYNLISYLKNGILKHVSPETAWYFLEAFIIKTSNNLEKYLTCYYDILNLCFEFELYKEGMQCIQIIEKKVTFYTEKRLLFYKMLYFSALDRHEENIKYYKKYKTCLKKNTQEYLNLLIIVQASFRGLNRRKECFEIFNEIYNNRFYMQYDEYGYFLRITNMYMTKHQSLKYLRKSYYFFKKRGLIHQAGKSAISYGHMLSSVGKLKKGGNFINIAEKMLEDKQMGCHMIYVNKAAIMLHNGIYNKEVWDYLDMAEMSTRVTFDKIAVQINKLVWHFGNNDFNNCTIIINQINYLCPQEPDKNVVAMAYYNLYLYYSYIQDEKNSKKYKQLAEKYKHWSQSVEYRLTNQSNRDLKFILNKPWAICFLEYWTYDLLY